MRLPEDEAVWAEARHYFRDQRMAAIRRNKLSDFGNIRSNGLIAMKLEEGEKLVSVKVCKADEDIMLTTRNSARPFASPRTRISASSPAAPPPACAASAWHHK